jgi:hypothetical protein
MSAGFLLSILVFSMTRASAAIPQPASPAPNDGSALETVLNEELIQGLRDPFSLPSVENGDAKIKRPELTLFPVNELKLNGVITGPKKLRAMISAPNGKTFFVKIGDMIGLRNGRVTQIRSDAITVLESEEIKGKRVSGAVELRIGGEFVPLSAKKGE